jgi:hypothetical protein
MRENREIPLVSEGSESGPAGEGASRKASMNASGKSDKAVVPTKRPNKGEKTLAEGVEGRAMTKGNTGEERTNRTPGRGNVSPGLQRVREAARKNKEQKFTALLHHVNEELLVESYYSLKRKAAPGVDGVTWKEYGEGVEGRIKELHDRIHRGGYRAQPSKRK